MSSCGVRTDGAGALDVGGAAVELGGAGAVAAETGAGCAVGASRAGARENAVGLVMDKGGGTCEGGSFG